MVAITPILTVAARHAARAFVQVLLAKAAELALARAQQWMDEQEAKAQ